MTNHLVQPTRDPEATERLYLENLNAIQNQKILEIGCGNGRLTQRYAHLASSITAIDPDPARLADALATNIPNANFLQADAIRLPLPNSTFDTVLFSWSL